MTRRGTRNCGRCSESIHAAHAFCRECGEIITAIILRAKEAGELEDSDIAALVGLSTQAVSNRYCRARRRTMVEVPVIGLVDGDGGI